MTIRKLIIRNLNAHGPAELLGGFGQDPNEELILPFTLLKNKDALAHLEIGALRAKEATALGLAIKSLTHLAVLLVEADPLASTRPMGQFLKAVSETSSAQDGGFPADLECLTLREAGNK